MSTETQVTWLLEQLRAAIQDAGVPLAEIDRRLGWRERTTSRVLGGRPRARLDHLFDILGAARIDPPEFFRRVAGRTDPALREMLDLAHRLEHARRRLEGWGSTSPPPAGPREDERRRG
jgi:hypothetical protein